MPPEELLERENQLRAALGVVLGQAGHRIDRRVANAAVDGDSQEVLVGAQVFVGENCRSAFQDDGAEQRLLRLGEPVRECRLAGADARDADRARLCQLTMNPPESLEERLRARSSELHERTQRVLATVEEGAGRGEAERALERLVGGLGDEHEMRLREVAAQASRAPLEVTARPTTCELLEEVLDQVLLRQLLDHLNLLEPDGHLARDGPAELDAGASLGDEEADQLAVRNQRHGDSRAAAAAGELRAELRETERLPGVPRLGIAGDALELLARRIEEVHMTGLRRQQRPRSFDDGLQQLLEGVRARDRFRKLRQLLELGDAELRLLVEPRVLDRARNE